MGAQLRVYRQKIKSAQTTKKITRAMELISASRIAKAQQRVAASTPYSRAVTRAVSAVATFSNIDHPLTTEPERIERAAVVIFTSDRGLAGAFSSNVLREAEQLSALLREQGKDVVYYLVGRKAVGSSTSAVAPQPSSGSVAPTFRSLTPRKRLPTQLLQRSTLQRARVA